MKDDHYRASCETPADYDAVIAWIAANNPAAARCEHGTPEDWAADAVNACIRSVVYGDAGGFCSTGMCIAVRVSNRTDMPGYKKVVLGITLLSLRGASDRVARDYREATDS